MAGIAEIFDGASLRESLTQAKASNEIPDDFSEFDGSSDADEDEQEHEARLESHRRVHLGGAAARVKPFTDLSDHLHKDLLSNVHFHDRVPFLVQHLTPLLTAEYDTLMISPPGRSQIEALLIPIINKMMLSLVDGRRMERRPQAVILSSNKKERAKIARVVEMLTRDLPIVSTEQNSLDGLAKFFTDMKDEKIDILVTTPAAYIAYTKRTAKMVDGKLRRYPSKISVERLRYLVIFELEECCDSLNDYSRIIVNHRKETQFTLIILTHTSFVNRGKTKKEFGSLHAETRSKLENLLNHDYGLVMVDSTVCISNIVVMSDSEISKIRHLRIILEHHKAEYFKVDEESRGSSGLLPAADANGSPQYKYLRRVLIVVSNERRARLVKGMLTSGGKHHDSIVDHDHILHLERRGLSPFTSELEYRAGLWKDPMKKLKTGQVIGLITTNIHGIRMGAAIVDKIIFFDVVPNLHSLVLNCSKVVDNRRNIFLLAKNDLIHKKKELQSLVQYLKDVHSDIPDDLRAFETPPISVTSIFK